MHTLHYTPPLSNSSFLYASLVTPCTHVAFYVLDTLYEPLFSLLLSW